MDEYTYETQAAYAQLLQILSAPDNYNLFMDLNGWLVYQPAPWEHTGLHLMADHNNGCTLHHRGGTEFTVSVGGEDKITTNDLNVAVAYINMS